MLNSVTSDASQNSNSNSISTLLFYFSSPITIKESEKINFDNPTERSAVIHDGLAQKTRSVSAQLLCLFPAPPNAPLEGGMKQGALTFLLKVPFLFPWPSQAVQGVGHLTAELVLTGDVIGAPGWVLVLFIIVVIQDGRLPNRHADDRIVGLQPGGAEAFPGLGAQQHGWDVVDFMRGFCARALLGDATTLLPAPLGEQRHGEHQQ